MAKRFVTSRTVRLAALIVLTGVWGVGVDAVELNSLVRIKGSESSKLTGMGLVMGLNGTGDGKKSLPTMRMLSNLMNNLGEEMATPFELGDAENVAVVFMSVTTPQSGFREGDSLDIQIVAPSAESLAGGVLLVAPLVGAIPGSPVYGFGSGAVVIPDPANPSRGVIRGGAAMVRDVYTRAIDDAGQITLVLHEQYADWTMADNIALTINGAMAPDGPKMCFALDEKNVVVQVPRVEISDPSAFISRLMQLNLDQTLVQTEARVVASRSSGTIVVTGDVEVSPVMVMHNGLTVTTINPTAPPTLERPEVIERTAIGIDPSGAGGANLQNLIAAFDQLKVPIDDRIKILEKIEKAGKLHANLIIED
ncbi:MAG: flagellar basal body P-ring protein FlgI [Planctomycetota bacterium]|jgi:flagellar P-ring protein precursor FlgI